MRPSDPTSSAAGSPARTYPRPARALASTASAPGSGGTSPAPLAFYDPESSCWRTSQLSLLEDSPTSLESLPASGSMRSGRLYERRTLGPRIDGIASSSWPTPCATSEERGATKSTARAGETMKGAMQGWAAPTAHDGLSVGSQPRARQGGESLRTQVERQWATPTSADAATTGSLGYDTTGRNEGTTLTDGMALHHGLQPREIRGRGSDGLVLNPAFVEALMGLPVGWTLVQGEPASDALATPLCPLRLRTRFED